MKREIPVLSLTGLLVLTLLSVFAVPVSAAAEIRIISDTSWVNKVGARETPSGRKIFKVTDYGAVNDGKTPDTRFIQKAIDACAAGGGGIVAFDPGEYLTGALFLRSGVELRVDEGVKISGSQDIRDYPLIPTRVAGIEMTWPAALINVLDQHKVSITGSGIIDGRGKPFWDRYWTMRKIYDAKGIRWAADYDCRRPRLILISRSSDITLKGLHLQRSGFWTVHILYSRHVTVSGITIRNNIGGHGPSTDGIDMDSSDFLLVENCDVDCNDDDYCLKAGRDADGLRVNRPTECVVIRNCTARSGGGLATFGSETSGGIRHVLVENSTAMGTSNGINFKSAFTRGGTVEDILIRNIYMDSVHTAININLNWNPNYSYTALPEGIRYDSIPVYWKVMLQKVPPSRGTPTIRNISIGGIEANDCRTAIHAIGMSNSALKNIRLSGIRISANTAGRIEYAKDWAARDIDIRTEHGDTVLMQHTVNVKMNGGVDRHTTTQKTKSNFHWPAVTRSARPWVRWWWPGSAVDTPGLLYNLRSLRQAGIGGVEVTPIYGVRGYEKKFIDYLSPEWMRMLQYTIHAARKLDMGVDMITGTGWPFGGPQIPVQQAASKAIFRFFRVEGGKRLNEKIEVDDPKQAKVAHLQLLMAYSNKGEKTDLTGRVGTDSVLNWQAPAGDWMLVAVFDGKTLQRVKRASPGGEGWVMDHFSAAALNLYLQRFTEAFKKSGCPPPHTFFDDSYEVYGADWTADIFPEFKKYRGYRLQDYLRELSGTGDPDTITRVIADYRQTIAEMLLHHFAEPWTAWAHRMRSITRYQAHGSPGNLLDLYAAADIPEIESYGSSHFDIPGLPEDSLGERPGLLDPLLLKFSSSAAHISGKKLASSETFTWLGEHFRVSLSQCKPVLDQLWIAGINHVYFHGSPYSPPNAPWPGWQFYASVNFSRYNPFWHDIPAFDQYIARGQSFLQSGASDNDVLIYFPVHDIWAMKGKSLLYPLSIGNATQWLSPTPFHSLCRELTDAGYSFDYISDDFLERTTITGSLLKTPGASYKALIIPPCDYIPIKTMRQILHLAERGARIIFTGSLPKDVPGLYRLAARRKELFFLEAKIAASPTPARNSVRSVGKGRIWTGNDAAGLMKMASIRPESFPAAGLQYIRRKLPDGYIYFIANLGARRVDQWIRLTTTPVSAVIYDINSARAGLARLRTVEGACEVYLQLEPGQALVLRTDSRKKSTGPRWPYISSTGKPDTLRNSWSVRFAEGQPEIHNNYRMDSLFSWTMLGDSAKVFEGTAVYTTTFTLPPVKADDWLLSLGETDFSARVRINGKDAGTLWAVPFELRIGKYLRPGENTLEVEVTNLAANRIADYDRKGINWKIFYEINFVNMAYRPFDASGWKPVPSGLIGPVTLKPVLFNQE